jgi:hypothetical protein
MSTRSICNTFKQQALRILQEVDRAGYTGLGIQEETISDLLLNRIQFEHEENFFTRKFTRKEEGNISGADWLWCIGEPGSWITFAVQAKIANLKTGRVRYLHYRGGEQYNLLINFCKEFAFIPKYSVYSKIDETTELVAKRLDTLRKVPLEQWSFSMISPKYIKNLSTRSQRHISSVLRYSVPLDDIYWELESQFRQEHNQPPKASFKRIIWENPQPSMMVTKEMPLLILYLLTQGRFAHKVPIANVSIYSSTPVQLALKTELERIEETRRWKQFPKSFERATFRIQDRGTEYLLPESTW